MVTELRPDLCIIGAGSAGLSVAAGAVQMGASVVLIEKGKMGGDCLNAGCVPSKSLLAAAHQAAQARRADLGVSAEPSIDFAAVRAHVHGVIAAIAPHDSVERFEGLGVRVIQAAATFRSPDTVEAGGHVIRPRRFVIATGSTPVRPPIPGLETLPALTNETVFDLPQLPRHLVIIGGGPIGCEMAQAFRNLGAAVTVIEQGTLLPKDDPELAAVVRARLQRDGVILREGAAVTAVGGLADAIEVHVRQGTATDTVTGTHLLLAVGRRAVVDGLNLDAAGIKTTRTGIAVDAGLRTSNRRAYAVGDCIGGLQFTHVAGYHAGIVVRNALFRLPARVSHAVIPWVTYTDPELAQVGLTATQARAQHGDSVRVLTATFADNDRARAEGRAQGLIKVVCSARGVILGAGIVGARAGELIQPWVLAMSQRLKIGAMATMIAPYPTLGEISKRAAGSFYTPALFSEGTRKLVRFLRVFG